MAETKLAAIDWPKIKTALIARWPSLTYVLADPDREDLDAEWYRSLREYDKATLEQAIKAAGDYWTDNPRGVRVDGLLPLIQRYAKGTAPKAHDGLPRPTTPPITERELPGALAQVRRVLERDDVVVEMPRRGVDQ